MKPYVNRRHCWLSNNTPAPAGIPWQEDHDLRVGLDIGSTTIKCAVLDEQEKLLYSTYERHYSHILEKAQELLRRIDKEYLHGGKALLSISGSAGLGFARLAAGRFSARSDRLAHGFRRTARNVYGRRPCRKRGGAGRVLDPPGGNLDALLLPDV